MGLLNLFKRKEAKLTESFEKIDDERVLILNLAQATRHLKIMRDSVDLVHQTIYPETFLSRYSTAMKEAKTVIQLCNGHEISKSAEEILTDLTRNKGRYYNDFLDRCNNAGKLAFAKNEIMDHQFEMPPESYSHFLELIERQTNKDDINEYIFCSVAFYESGKLYYYLSDDPNLRCGDYVTVPVGKTNEEKTGRIAKIEVYQGNTAPVPVDQLKYIITSK